MRLRLSERVRERVRVRVKVRVRVRVRVEPPSARLLSQVGGVLLERQP